MALTHSTATRNSLCSAVSSAVDAGTTNSGGQFIFRTSAEAAVATVQLQNPAFGTPASGAMSINGTPLQDTNAAGGTVDHFTVEDRDNTEVFRGTATVTGGGGDIEMSSLTISAGDTVELSSFTYNASA